MFGNIDISVSGAPNQTVVDLLGNTLTLNEQIHNLNGSLTVNALDLRTAATINAPLFRPERDQNEGDYEAVIVARLLSLLGGTSRLRVSSSTAGFTGGASTLEPGSMALPYRSRHKRRPLHRAPPPKRHGETVRQSSPLLKQLLKTEGFDEDSPCRDQKGRVAER